MLTVCRVSSCEYVSEIGKTWSMMPSEERYKKRHRAQHFVTESRECKDWHKQTMKHAFIIWRRQDGRNIGEHRANGFPFYWESATATASLIWAHPISFIWLRRQSSSPARIRADAQNMTMKNKTNTKTKACNQIKEFLSGLKRIREWKVNKDSI